MNKCPECFSLGKHASFCSHRESIVESKSTLKVICLCGSTRFKREFEEVNRDLTINGFIVLSVGVFGHVGGVELSKKVKRQLDELHLRKIDMADAVYIINPGNYIGESTRREIAYAEATGKPVKFFCYGGV